VSHPLPQARRDLWRELPLAPAHGDEHATQSVTFTVPDEWKERTLIRFGAVD
jgi:hypothetical protein